MEIEKKRKEVKKEGQKTTIKEIMSVIPVGRTKVIKKERTMLNM